MLDNVTIRSNTAITEGGGLVVAGENLTMTNSALYLNDAPVGAGLLVNGEDGNCAVEDGAIVSQGGNTSSDTTCQDFLDGETDQNDVDVEIPDDEPDEDFSVYLPQVGRPE